MFHRSAEHNHLAPEMFHRSAEHSHLAPKMFHRSAEHRFTPTRNDSQVGKAQVHNYLPINHSKFDRGFAQLLPVVIFWRISAWHHDSKNSTLGKHTIFSHAEDELLV